MHLLLVGVKETWWIIDITGKEIRVQLSGVKSSPWHRGIINKGASPYPPFIGEREKKEEKNENPSKTRIL